MKRKSSKYGKERKIDDEYKQLITKKLKSNNNERITKYCISKMKPFEIIQIVSRELYKGNRVRTSKVKGKESVKGIYNKSTLIKKEEYEIIGTDSYIYKNVVLINKKEYKNAMKGKDDKSNELRRIYEGIRKGWVDISSEDIKNETIITVSCFQFHRIFSFIYVEEINQNEI